MHPRRVTVINLTQAFVFETDSAKSLLAILDAIVPIALHSNSDYCKLHLKKKQPSSYDDGKYDDYRADRQSGLETVDGKAHLISPSRTYRGTTFYKITESFANADEAASKSYQDFNKLPKAKPTRKWITTLADYPRDETDIIKCSSFKQMLQKTEAILSGPGIDGLKKDLFQDCRNEYQGLDGSTATGFRVEHRPNVAFAELDISMIFVYYGK